LLEKATSLRPFSKWAYRTMADINLELGNKDQARELYEAVLHLDPQDDWSQAQLSKINDEGP
jgi:tetratricopeptide (TPR) repeat protein